MAFTKPRAILQRGTRAAQPTATAVAEGALYFVTDERVLERSTALAWESYSATADMGVSSPTTTGAITALASSVRTYRFNNATSAVIHGIAAGYHGQRIQFVSIGAGDLYFKHESSTDGTAANRLICFATSGTDGTPCAAGIGTAEFMYDATTARWRMVSHNQGNWIVQTFNAGDFTGNGSMTVTVASGDVNTYKYFLEGRKLTVRLIINTITIGGTPNTNLQVAIPGGFSSGGPARNVAFIVNNGVAEVGRIFWAASGTNIVFQRPGAVNWTAAADLAGIETVMTGEVT
jgi:hypothetical protein